MTFKRNVATSTGFGANNPLVKLLGCAYTLNGGNAVSVDWKVPCGYEVYCNLVHSYALGKPSHLMSKFPNKGNPFDLVEHPPPPPPISLNYDLSCDLVLELQITIKVDG